MVLFFSGRGQRPGFAFPDLDLLVQAEPRITDLMLPKTRGAEEAYNTGVGNGDYRMFNLSTTASYHYFLDTLEVIERRKSDISSFQLHIENVTRLDASAASFGSGVLSTGFVER